MNYKPYILILFSPIFHHLLSAVFVLGGYGGTVRKLMLAAYRLGMTRSGYAFISYEVLLSSCKQSQNATEDAIACEAYEGLLDISLFVPSTLEYKNFTREVRRRMVEEPFNRTMKDSEQVIEAMFIMVVVTISLHQFSLRLTMVYVC